MTARTSSGAVDLKIAHLAMIQGVIGRVSGYSANAKNFCITICAAIIAVGFQKGSPMLNWASLGVVGLFFLMDTYYLSLERRYRAFYEQVTRRPPETEPDMSLRAEPLTLADFGKAMFSVSVLPFYALLMASMVALLYVANHEQHAASQAPAVSTRGVAGAGEQADSQRAIEADRNRVQPIREADANTVSAR
jgi:hypothetical protein